MAFRVRALELPLSLLAAIVAAALLLLATGPATVLAVEPIDLREDERPPQSPEDREAVAELLRELASAQASATPEPTPTASPTPAAPGYDISYPQCGRALPEEFSFSIVGVNGGRVHSTNPCLGPGEHASQLEWAGPDADLYANTGNPGPELSSHWPNSQLAPRACDTRENPGADARDCSFVYGWNAAAHSYQTALDAFISLGWADADADRIPGDRTWWLDVEDANSWRNDRDLNIASLEGAVAYLESVGVTEVGFYSTPRLWDRITGGTDAFADHPAWHAGALDAADARERCDGTGFTGGELRMVQWVENNLDANYRCP